MPAAGEVREATPSPTFFLHPCSEALLKPAVSALVPFVFVYHTLPVKPGEKERCEEQPDSWRQDKTEPHASRYTQSRSPEGPPGKEAPVCAISTLALT